MINTKNFTVEQVGIHIDKGLWSTGAGATWCGSKILSALWSKSMGWNGPIQMINSLHLTKLP